jgi:hypothetical protein
VSSAFFLVSSSFFYRSATSFCAWRTMTSLTRWISRASAISTYSFAPWVAAAFACAFTASRSRPVRACAR